ncbi:MAG: DNA repair protein RadC [Elusimicrobia bacterium]|nr:DNA repair protein RadC [Elusimicrobiota bacterium]
MVGRRPLRPDGPSLRRRPAQGRRVRPRCEGPVSGLPQASSSRPRERLLARGPAALSEAELLSCVLGTGLPGQDALALSEALLCRHPEGGAARLAAALELARRWAGASPASPEPIDSPRRALRELGELAPLKKEHFVALYLDATHRPLHRETVSVGTLTASLVHPREVFAPALERPAAALIVAHNHPSGDPEPSREDRETTRRLCEAGRILGLPVLDHLIVAARGYFSFRERGLMEA